MLYDDLSDDQKSVFHALHSLGNIGKIVVGKYQDTEVFEKLKEWSGVFAAWVVTHDILSMSEMEEVLEYGSEVEREEQKAALTELGNLLKEALDSDDNPLMKLLADIEELGSDAKMPDNVQELNDLFNLPAYDENEEENS